MILNEIKKLNERRPKRDQAEQLITHLKNLGFKVFGREAMEKFLKEHNLQNLQQARMLYNSDLLSSEIEAIQDYIVTLPLDTDTSKGLYFYNEDTKQIYKFNTSLHQYRDNRLEGRDGFEILEKSDTSYLTEEQLIEIENGIKENKTGFDSWLKRTGYEKRTSNDSNVIVKNGETVDNNDGLDSNSLSRTSRRRQSNRDSKSNQGKSEIETFTTPQGEVFGFVDKEGNIYLDETKISPEHPIHEYTHLWDRALQQRNPELWNRGVELMKQIPLWNEILSCNRKIT